ncbi:rh217 [macacine betaherpesvirus 3]|uniref:Rh217 n=1 Tax=Rhesus cytomegalovirus (strain 68-1) TaxID=47929 RepID=Q2FA80_RHCM6|nr:rh217 [macacine betaherpesvirus 3]
MHNSRFPTNPIQITMLYIAIAMYRLGADALRVTLKLQDVLFILNGDYPACPWIRMTFKHRLQSAFFYNTDSYSRGLGSGTLAFLFFKLTMSLACSASSVS